MITASTSAAPVTTIPRPRISRSFSLGTSRIASPPTRGRNVVIVIAELSQVIGSPRSLSSSGSSDLDEDDRHREHPGEQPDRVPLDVARLEVLEEPARLARDVRKTVHRAVDDVAVEP